MMRILKNRNALTGAQWAVIVFIVVMVMVILSYLIVSGKIFSGEGGILYWLDRLTDIL